MFQYNTRTELLNGTRFLEKDILLFDYVYSGDLIFQVDAIMKSPGFGFVIEERFESGLQGTDNAVLFSFSIDGSYQIITKVGVDQTVVANRFVETGTLIADTEISFLFEKEDEVISIYKGIREKNGDFKKLRLLEYRMRYDMPSYQIGIYSNGGNTVTFASVQTEAPSNWVSNVLNARGGRIRWIRNGFTIEDSIYDIEVEAIDIHLKKGQYWFDYQTDNPEMEAFVYETYRKDTNEKRPTKEIRRTMEDEFKNILEPDGSFYLPADHAVNIKFKGKWGTVTNICVKSNKEDGFVETDNKSTVRPGSRIVLDLNRISGFKIRGTILSVPAYDPGEARPYYIFRRGRDNVGLYDVIQTGKELSYEFSTEDNMVRIDGETFMRFNDETVNLMYIFENVTAILDEFIVTLKDGTEVNILLQKTLKTTVSQDITSPIIVTGLDGEPFDLSSSYRQHATIEPVLELKDGRNEIKLNHIPDMTDPAIKLYGILSGVPILDKDGKSIAEIAESYTEIPYTTDAVNLLKRIVKIPYETRTKYRYVVVSYNAVTSYKYIFTNWEREIYDLKDEYRIYMEEVPLNLASNIVIYGIRDEVMFNKNWLYYIPDRYNETSIAMCAYAYDTLQPGEYDIDRDTARVTIDPELMKKYRYLIIDYLKNDSYAVNHKVDCYEVDIATEQSTVNVIYDSEDGLTTKTYRILASEKMILDTDTNKYEIEDADFVVLEEYNEDLSQ